MKKIHAQKGAFVRHIIKGLRSKIWGGKRTKKEVILCFADRSDMYDDLKAILEEGYSSDEAEA